VVFIVEFCDGGEERGRIGVKMEDLKELKALHANLVAAFEMEFKALKISGRNECNSTLSSEV
jgi:hypothetical protein